MKCHIGKRGQTIRDLSGAVVGRVYIPEDCALKAEDVTEGITLTLMYRLTPILEGIAGIAQNADGSARNKVDEALIHKAEELAYEELNRVLGTDQARTIFSTVRPFALTRDGYFIQLIIERLPALLDGR